MISLDFGGNPDHVTLGLGLRVSEVWVRIKWVRNITLRRIESQQYGGIGLGST